MRKRNGANILSLFIDTGVHVQALPFIKYASLESQSGIAILCDKLIKLAESNLLSRNSADMLNSLEYQ